METYIYDIRHTWTATNFAWFKMRRRLRKFLQTGKNPPESSLNLVIVLFRQGSGGGETNTRQKLFVVKNKMITASIKLTNFSENVLEDIVRLQNGDQRLNGKNATLKVFLTFQQETGNV